MIRGKGTTLSPQRKKHKNGYVIRQKNIRRPKHRNSFFFLCLIEILHGKKKMRLAGVYAQAPLSLCCHVRFGNTVVWEITQKKSQVVTSDEGLCDAIKKDFHLKK